MRVLIFLFLLFVIGGCSPREKVQERKETPKKILSLSAAATKILLDLGVPPAAIDEYGVIAAGKRNIPVIGKGSAVSLEKMVELGINYVILWDYQSDAARLFRKNGLAVIELPPFRLDLYGSLIWKLGVMLGRKEKAEQLVLEFEKQIEKLPPPEKRKNVYFELYGPMKSAGKESYTGDLLAKAGGVLLNKKTGLINVEKLLDHQPEIIFYVEGFSSEEEIIKRPGFSGFPAVKNKRIYAVPRLLITEGLAPLEAVHFFKNYVSKE